MTLYLTLAILFIIVIDAVEYEIIRRILRRFNINIDFHLTEITWVSIILYSTIVKFNFMIALPIIVVAFAIGFLTVLTFKRYNIFDLQNDIKGCLDAIQETEPMVTQVFDLVLFAERLAGIYAIIQLTQYFFDYSIIPSIL